MNPHPVLAAFPVALLTSIIIFEVISSTTKHDLRNVARANLYLAVVFSVLAFLSGYIGSEMANATFTVPDESIETHHLFGKLLLFAIFPCVALRYVSDVATHNAKVFRWGYLSLLVVSFGLVICGGFLGGKLVFEHGAGVKAIIGK